MRAKDVGQGGEGTGVSGGQFAAKNTAEQSVDLSWNDGSFEYPPYHTSADESLRFWSSVEVPEWVSRKVLDDNYAIRKKFFNDEYNRIRPQCADDRDAERKALEATDSTHPPITTRSVVPLIRAVRIHDDSLIMRKDGRSREADALSSVKVPIRGEMLTPEEACERYKMVDYATAICEPTTLSDAERQREEEWRQRESQRDQQFHQALVQISKQIDFLNDQALKLRSIGETAELEREVNAKLDDMYNQLGL